MANSIYKLSFFYGARIVDNSDVAKELLVLKYTSVVIYERFLFLYIHLKLIYIILAIVDFGGLCINHTRIIMLQMM